MDVIVMILCLVVVLSVLVFIHEGGHYLTARAFGVRVTEFMIGLPGPRVGFTWHGTKFGVTAVPLGGYARVCGMEPGAESPHLEQTMAFAYERGTVYLEDVAAHLGISDDEAYAALDELAEWGTLAPPHRKDKHNVYRTPAIKGVRAEGAPDPLDDPHAFYESERRQQYRSLPFWKRSLILLAGPLVNLLFAVVAFVLIFSVMGVDVQNTQTGEITHMSIGPLEAVVAGFSYIGAVVVSVAQLFNPATASQVVESSVSVVGMAVISKSYLDAGLVYLLYFTAMISVSLGVMNLLPIPPLDGGRFLVEIVQRIRRKEVTLKTLNYISMAGMALFICFFLVMVNQDVQRFVFGNW